MNKLAVSLIAAGIAASAFAQTPATPAAPATPGAPAAARKPIAPGDKKWLKDVSEAVLIEQKFLDLVVNNKTATYTEETKKATGQMSGELKRFWTALATLAQDKGGEVASEVSKNELSKVSRMQKEKADEFEKEFFKDLGKEAKQTAKLFDASKTLQDPDIKRFAEDWATTFKGHGAAAASTEKALTGKK